MYIFCKEKIAEDKFKYYFKKNTKIIKNSDFIKLLKNDDFLKVLNDSFIDARNEFEEYFWECCGIFEKENYHCDFEFVIIKKIIKKNDVLEQNFLPFREKINKMKENEEVISFNSNSGNILVIPIPIKDKNYSSLSNFIFNSNFENKKKIWERISIILEKETKKSKIYLSTNGESVNYVHFRIEKKPNYYKHYKHKEYIECKNDEIKIIENDFFFLIFFIFLFFIFKISKKKKYIKYDS